ncbi:hypothetical protein [Polaribacter porphyrae]|uniref:C-type lectin domain-containing protein n=1 Tax=Polaribacter porphyrae TaxID=1137780 RepID=A0A2S7WRF4_9FLAO|nr:hypothetical protein [Polaribacter porphyrae]PQJ79882.1 hypothetical protein BTO18_12170 [Polaribacter porphyrae]
MRQQLLLIVLLISSLTFSQNFKLTQPNILKLKKQNSTEVESEIIYHYLTNNYKTTSKKYDIKYYEWDKSKICAYSQKFKNGIQYAVSKCKESGGIMINLEIPKIKRVELMKWIENIYEVDKAEEEQYIWKENNSKFEPKEQIPGCYYKIIEKEKKTQIELYCGC